MRRTQLYLDDQLWSTLHARARREKTTVSDLVRRAVREQYLGNHEQRMLAMEGIVGIRKSSSTTRTAVQEVRKLRRGTRLDRLNDQ